MRIGVMVKRPATVKLGLFQLGKILEIQLVPHKTNSTPPNHITNTANQRWEPPTTAYRIRQNKRPPRNKHPPKTLIFPRGEYMKTMAFNGWFFQGGSTQNRWVLMGDFSKGGVHKTERVLMGDFSKGGVHRTKKFLRVLDSLSYCFWKLSARGVYFGKYGTSVQHKNSINREIQATQIHVYVVIMYDDQKRVPHHMSIHMYHVSAIK